MEVSLKVVVGANAGKELKVPGPKFFIGRAEDCHLRPKSDLISRHHCVLLIDGLNILGAQIWAAVMAPSSTMNESLASAS